MSRFLLLIILFFNRKERSFNTLKKIPAAAAKLSMYAFFQKNRRQKVAAKCKEERNSN